MDNFRPQKIIINIFSNYRSGKVLSVVKCYTINERIKDMDKIAKKTIIVHILRILYCYTSIEYPATQTNIANYLNDIDIPCDRKTVGRNIKYLIDMGLPIVENRGTKRGYYYDMENDKFFNRKEF